MKKILIACLITAAAVFILQACKKSFLTAEPQTGAAFDQTYFKSKKDFVAFTFGAYSELGGTWNFAPLGKGMQGWVVESNIFLHDVNQGSEQPYDLNTFATPTSQLASGWTVLYKIISRANVLLEKLVSDGAVLTAAEKDFAEGEAKFLRGFAYYSLAQKYGDAILYLKSYDVSDAEALSLARSPEAQVWAQAIADLTAAAQKLPKDWDVANLGRATKGSALGYLANAYMYTKEWPKAKQASIDLDAVGKYSLLPTANIRDLFSYQTENTPESIFEIQYYFVPGAKVNWDGSPNYGQFLNWVCGPQGIGNDYAVFNGTGAVVGSMQLANSFEPNDVRRQQFIKVAGESYKGETMKTTVNIPLNVAQKNSCFSAKWWTGTADNITNIQEWWWAQNIIAFRYAEFLLNYSEILFESGDAAGAYSKLNLVRARAGLTPRPMQANKETFFTHLMKERRSELNFEPNLWFHYTRTGRAAKFLLNEYAFTMQTKWNHYPVPQGDIDLNPKIVQNAGY